MCQINTIKVPVDFIDVVCVVCGVQHFIPYRMHLYFREHGQPVHCPNGHQTFYIAAEPPQVESKQVRDLRGQVAQLTHQLDQAEARSENK